MNQKVRNFHAKTSMKTFNITTLGCKVNQHDGRLIRENLLSAGRKDS